MLHVLFAIYPEQFCWPTFENHKS